MLTTGSAIINLPDLALQGHGRLEMGNGMFKSLVSLSSSAPAGVTQGGLPRVWQVRGGQAGVQWAALAPFLPGTRMLHIRRQSPAFTSWKGL